MMGNHGMILPSVFLVFAGWASAPPAVSTGVLVPMVPPTQPIDQLLINLRSSVAITRAGAAEQLAAVPPSAEVASALDAALDDPEVKVREAAAWALGHVDPKTTSWYEESPRPIRITRPTYPRPAFSKRVQGTVQLEIVIDEAGKVARAEVRRSIPDLDRAALECVKKWSFAPARRKGKPAPVFVRAPVTFRIGL